MKVNFFLYVSEIDIKCAIELCAGMLANFGRTPGEWNPPAHVSKGCFVLSWLDLFIRVSHHHSSARFECNSSSNIHMVHWRMWREQCGKCAHLTACLHPRPVCDAVPLCLCSAVLAFAGSPASYPVLETNAGLQRYFQWSDSVRERAAELRRRLLPVAPFVGVHLRLGPDWVSRS